MADILASVSVVLGAEVSAFKAAMADARRELKGLREAGESMQNIGANLSKYVSAPITAFGGIAVAASAKLESLRNGLQAIAQQELGAKGITGLGAVSEAARLTGQRVTELLNIAKQPGLSFEGAEAADIRLRAVGVSAEQSAKSIKAFGNAIATTGGGADEFNRVTVQLAQLSAKGKVLAQDLRPIIEAAPAVASALQRLYGTVDSETISASLAKQGQSSKDFIRVLTTELAKLPQVTGGLKAIYENDMDALLVASAKVGDSLAKTFNLQGIGQQLGDEITALGESFASLSAPTQELIAVLGLGAVATGPLLVGLGTLGVALPAVKAGILAVGSAAELLSTGLLALANPTTLAIAGLAALAGGAYYLATANERAYDSFLKQSAATQKLTLEVSPLLDRYDELRAKTTLTTSEQLELKAILEKVTAVMPAAGQGLDNYGNYLGLATTKARELITANQGLEKAIALKSLPAQQQKLADLEKQYANLIRIRDGFNTTGQFKYSADDKTGYAPGTKELIEFRSQLEQTNVAVVAQQKVVAALGAAVNGTTGNYRLFNEAYKAYQERFYAANTGSTNQIQILATLKARLKEVQDQRDKETTVGAIKVDNTEILNLQKKIAALEGTDKSSKKAADALAKLRQELFRLTALDRILGDTPDQVQVLTRRADTLEKGLKTLVDNGVSTSSKAFRALAKDFVDTSQAAEKLMLGIGKGGVDQLDLKPVDVKSLIPQTIGDTLPQDVARSLGDYAKRAIPFELPVAAKLNMQGITDAMIPVQLLSKELLALSNLDIKPNFDGLVPKELNAELLNIGAAFRQIDGAEQLGILFDSAGAKAQQLQSSLQNLLAAGANPASDGMKKLGLEFKELAVNSQAAQAVKASITSLASGISDAFADALSGTQGIGDALIQTLLGTVSSLATQLGSILLASGLGIEALKVSLQNFTGVGAIAAGLGLLAIGGIAKGAMSSLGKGGAASAGVGVSPTPSNYGQNSSTQTVRVIAEFRLRGQDLVAVARSDAYRSDATG